MSFLDEVKEQAVRMRNLVDYYGNEGNNLLDEAVRLINKKPARSIVFLGMGTSCISPLIIRDTISNNKNLIHSVWDAGEFLHYAKGSLTDRDVVIAVSQSGESIETKKCVELIRKNSRIISITNNPDSTIAKLSNINLPQLAGDEASVSNKTYSNTLAVLLLLGNKIIHADISGLMKDFLECAKEMDKFHSSRKDEINKAVKFLKQAKNLHFMARGPASVAAMQGSLTWMEGVRMPTAYFSGGSFRHGPFELVGKNHYVVCYATEGKGGDLTDKLARDISKLGSKVLVFSGRKIRTARNLFVIEISPHKERIFPIACAVPQELLLAGMAEDRGIVPGEFSRIGKITKIE